MIEAGKKAKDEAEIKVVALEKIRYIHYLDHFKKSTIDIEALIIFASEIKAMTVVYTFKLGPRVCYTNIRA